MSTLDNGVMPNKPKLGGSPSERQEKGYGKSLNFFNAIARGDNEKGQTTIAPAMVVRAGVCVSEQRDHPRSDFGGSRWNRDTIKY